MLLISKTFFLYVFFFLFLFIHRTSAAQEEYRVIVSSVHGGTWSSASPSLRDVTDATLFTRSASLLCIPSLQMRRV